MFTSSFYYLLITASFLYVLYQKFSDRNAPDGPRGYPILGNVMQLGKQPHKTLAKLYEQYGTVFKIRMFCLDVVVLTEPQVLKEAFVDNAKIFESRHEKHSRRLNTPITPAKIKRMEPIIKEEINQLCTYFSSYAKSGEPLDPARYIKRCSLNIILLFLFGMRYPYESSEDDEMLTAILKIVPNEATFFPGDYIPLIRPFTKGKPLKYYTEYAQMSKMIEDIVSSRLVTFDVANDTKDFLDVLLIQYVNKTIELRSVVTSCIELIMTGTDTTATTTLFMMIAMANNPEIQDKMRTELTEKTSDVLIVSDKTQTPYTNACIKECTRRYPVVPLGIPHVVSEDVEFRGYHLKKGTMIFQNIYASCLSPNVWGNPLVFHPDRFMGENNSNNNKIRMVFGTGSRNCLGMGLADSELYLLIGSLFKQFTFKRLTEEPILDDGAFGVAITPYAFKVLLTEN
eukprot:gene16632-19761_t